MVSTLVFAFLAADPSARYNAFMQTHPTLAATLEISAGGRVLGTGTARINRPRRIRFDFKGSNMDYVLSSTELGYVELDRAGRIYDEHGPVPGLRLYESRISDARTLFPHHLIPQTVAALLGPGKPTVAAVAGGDEITMVTKSAMGDFIAKLLVDPQGRPARYTETGPKGTFSWRTISIAAGNAGLASYRVEPPLGYVPHALSELPQPLAIGEQAPLTGWRRNGTPIDLAEPQRGSPRLLAVLGADCPASRAARPALASLAKSLPVHIIGPGEITDPSGTLLKRLSPPGTPMFYMVGIDGKVTHLWFGFDSAKSTTWQAEVRASLKGPAKD